jgi:hypothetical protein
MVKKFKVKKSWVERFLLKTIKSLGLKAPGLKLGVEKSRRPSRKA